MGVVVNCLIVGAQKSGTTALAAFLAEHPGICVAPGKEVHLFDAPDFRDTREHCDAVYDAAFPNYRGQPVVLEATPIYMFLPAVAERIRRYNPAMRLIVMLRHPGERALSHYAMERTRQSETQSLAVALAAEPYRLRASRGDLSWQSAQRTKSYLSRGFYSRQIRRLESFFPREQILVLRNEDLRHRHAATLDSVYRFLAIAPPPTVPAARDVRPEVPDGGRPITAVPYLVSLALALVYRREIARLERRLGLDLAAWRRPLWHG